MRINKYISIIFLTILFFGPLTSSAISTDPAIGGSVSFDLTPKNPGSLTNVLVKAVSFEIDLNSANISWYLNGQLEKEGFGQKQFSFQTGKAGTVTTIKLLVKNENTNIERTMRLNPADVNIVWEADTYVPPFYKGKAMPSPKSSVRVIALPNFVTEKGTPLSSGELVYEWKQGTNIIASGGDKKNALMQMGSPLSDSEISVKVSNTKGDIIAEKTLKITPEDPIVLFYEEKPVEGTEYGTALQGTADFSENEISLRAEPFFFSYPASLSEKNLAFTWTMNGKGVTPNDGTPKIITLRNETGNDVTSNLSLLIKNITKTFQSAQNSLRIKSSSKFSF